MKKDVFGVKVDEDELVLVVDLVDEDLLDVILLKWKEEEDLVNLSAEFQTLPLLVQNTLDNLTEVVDIEK